MKRTVALLLSLMLVFTFVGCGDETVSSTQSKTESKAESKTESKVESKEESTVESVVSEIPNTQEQTKENVIRVASYNIANGSKCGHNFQLLADDIKRNNIDIVGLQEVDYLCDRSKNTDTMKTLSQLTGLDYFAYYKAINLPGGENGNDGEYGIGILSKYPITDAKKTELESFGDEQRILGYAKIDVNGTTVNFFNTHLTFKSEQNRAAQMEIINENIKGKKNVFITGDFNVTAISEYSQINLSCVNTEDDPHETWIAKYEQCPTNCIDNIFYSKQFKKIQSKVEQREHSDHKMLYAEFEIIK